MLASAGTVPRDSPTGGFDCADEQTLLEGTIHECADTSRLACRV